MEYFYNFDKIKYLTEMKPEGCILCLQRDGSNQVPDLRVLETNTHIAAVNLYPYNPGHLLVYPKRHLLDVRNFSHAEELNLTALTKYLLNLLDQSHTPKGYNIGYNMGPVAGASIEHIHLHIIPRYPRETGIADLVAGKRVLVENPVRTMERLKKMISRQPFSIFNT